MQKSTESKAIKQTAFTIAITAFVLSPVVFGQDRKITADEFDHVKAESKYKSLHKAVRIKTTSNGPEAGVSSESVREEDADGSYHYIETTRTDGKERTVEMISVASRSYLRLGGKWIRGGFGGTGTDSESGDPLVTVEYSYLGRGKVNGQMADHYRKVLIRKYSDAKSPTQRITQDYWFSTDGLLIKESFESQLDMTTRHLVSVTVYEYDPKIKIIEPKID